MVLDGLTVQEMDMRTFEKFITIDKESNMVVIMDSEGTPIWEMTPSEAIEVSKRLKKLADFSRARQHLM